MKKIFVFAIVLSVLLGSLLSGCSIDPASTSSGDSTEGGSSTGGNTAVIPTWPEYSRSDAYGIDLVNTDGWAVNAASLPFGVIVDDGYYYVSTISGSDLTFLKYLDMNSDISVYLCSNVECTHKTIKCEAYLPDLNTQNLMFFWSGGLYYIEMDSDGFCALLRRNEIGIALQTVTRLGENLLDSKQSLTVDDYVQAGKWLYYYAAVDSIVNTDEGSYAETVKTYLCRVNLSTGKDQVLVESPAGYVVELVTARDDAMVYTIMQQPQPDDPEMDMYDWMGTAEYASKRRAAPKSLMRWDEGTGESTELLRLTYSQLSSPKAYGGQVAFYTFDGDRRFTYDLKTGELTERKLFNGSIISSRYLLQHVTSTGSRSILDMQTGEKLPFKISGQNVRIRNISDEWLILSTGSVYKPDALYYIPISSLSDGLTMANAMLFPE